MAQELAESDLTVLEKELLLQARRLYRDDLRRLVAQARALADLAPSPKEAQGKTAQEIAETLFGKSFKKAGKKK